MLPLHYVALRYVATSIFWLGTGKMLTILQCRKYMSVRSQPTVRKKTMTCLILVVGIEDSLQRIQTDKTQTRLGENIQRSLLASIASLVLPVFWCRLNSVYRSIHFSNPFGFHACVSHHLSHTPVRYSKQLVTRLT
jgi:hypothetical protein